MPIPSRPRPRDFTALAPASFVERTLGAADWAMRHCAPLALEATGRRELAAELRALAPITDRASAEAALRASRHGGAPGPVWHPGRAREAAISAQVTADASLAAAADAVTLARAVSTDDRNIAGFAAEAAISATNAAWAARQAGVDDPQLRWVIAGTPPHMVGELLALALA